MEQPLEKGKSPFNVIFEYGANSDGYWTYDHMILQLEDIVDVLDALYLVPCDGIDSDHMILLLNCRAVSLMVLY